MRRGPWTSVSSQERSLADWTEQGRGLSGVFRRGPALEARQKLGEIERSSSRTCRWSRWGLGWPVARRPRRAAGGGDGMPRRRRSEGLGRRLAGLRGPLGRGEAVPEVGWSRGRAEEGSPRGGRGRRQPWRPAAVLDDEHGFGLGFLGSQRGRGKGRGFSTKLKGLGRGGTRARGSGRPAALMAGGVECASPSTCPALVACSGVLGGSHGRAGV